MKMKFFDFEIYPEWWCVTVSDEEPSYLSDTNKLAETPETERAIKNKMRVYTSDGGKEEINRYIADTSTGVLTGYNSKRYDMVIQRCIAMHFTPRQLYIANGILIEKVEYPPEMNVTVDEIYRIGQYVRGWSAKWQGAQASQDLMDDSDGGLKNKEASMGMDIRECSVPFGKMNLTAKEKAEIIEYNQHDVYALHVLYITVSRPYINNKLLLGKIYNVPMKTCYESTNAVLVGKVLGAERTSGTTIVDPTITIYEQKLKEYFIKWVPADILEHLLTSQKAKIFKIFQNKVSYGDGGIHSIYETPKVGRASTSIAVEACEEWGIYNADLMGCHPHCMLFAGAMYRSIRKPERLKESVLKRRALKLTPKSQWTPEDIEFVPAAKLIHNTAYGAGGNKQLPLHDDYMRSKVCRVSQLIITAVANAIYTLIPDAKIIQTNTDGIMVYCKRVYKDSLAMILKEFDNLSEFMFEIEEDIKVWQLNVNNYIAQHPDKSTKLKGKSFVQDVWTPGTNKIKPLGMHVIAKARYAFWVDGQNPIKFILEHDRVNDFVLSCTKGGTYHSMVHETANGDIDAGKISRVIAIKDETLGAVRKLKTCPKTGAAKRDLVATCPPQALIVNDALYNYHIEGPMSNRELVHADGRRWQIDMSYYARRIGEALDIPWYQFKNGKLQFTEDYNL